MRDQVTNEPTVEAPLDNWYGGPRKVGLRDIIVGLTFLAVVTLTLVVTVGLKDLKDQDHIKGTVTCPKCNHIFEK